MGVFIRISVTAETCAAETECRECVQICPVDIFQRDSELHAQIISKQEDECILCDLCVSECPVNAISIKKLY
jgi:NAD-dependent dihydropyrimidine dehydrogenase PreA subunit